jgi:glutathione S-transferase
MITLHTSGSYFGLPDPSPFVVKAMMLLKMSGVPFECKPMSFREAPKSKVPYIRDGDLLLGDSHFIARHLEAKHGVDFTGGYSQADLAKGWTISRMLEEHLYFLIVHDRWANDANFDKGPRQFFKMAPAPIRPFVTRIIRGKVRKMLHAQGIGRHTDAERMKLAKGDVSAVDTLLGQSAYMLGNRISEVDAVAFAFLSSAACKHFDSRFAEEIRSRPALMAYLNRLRQEYFPEMVL